MKRIVSEEKSILIAPFFIILLVFFVPVSSSMKSIMAVLSLAAIFITPYYRKHLSESFNTLWAATAILFFLYVLIASLWSDAPYSMRFNVVEKYSKLVYLPILAVAFIHPKVRRWTFNAYFAVMLITCLISFLKHQGIFSINNPEDSGEVFHNHIATGFMVALAVYFAGVLAFETQINKWQRAYYILMIVIGSYQIFFLNTGRTGYVIYGLLMSLLILQKLSFKKAVLGIALLGSAIVLIYSLSPLMQVRTAALVSDIKYLQQHEENTSIGFRVQFHQYAETLFKRQPIIGLGTGTFKYRYSQEQPIPAWDTELNDPHSQYWLTLAEQGVIGLTLFLIFMASLFINLLKLQETKPILLGMLVSFCMGSFSDTIFCYSTVGTLLIIISALCFGELLQNNVAQELVRKRQSSASFDESKLAVSV